MLKALVIGSDAHLLHLALYTFANGVINHGAGDGSSHAKTGRQVCRHIVLPAGYMKAVLVRLRKGNNPRIQPGYKSPQGQQIMNSTGRSRNG